MALAGDFYTQVEGRNISKDKRVRSQAMTMAYDSPFFPANVFRNKVHWTPIPPFVSNTRGVKFPFSTSNALVDIVASFHFHDLEKSLMLVFSACFQIC